jgi:hypothetical protein
MPSIGFEIHIQGVVDETALGDAGDLTVDTVSTTTVLTGQAVDQAALLGVLARLREHGLVITELRRRLPDDARPPHGE